MDKEMYISAELYYRLRRQEFERRMEIKNLKDELKSKENYIALLEEQIRKLNRIVDCVVD